MNKSWKRVLICFDVFLYEVKEDIAKYSIVKKNKKQKTLKIFLVLLKSIEPAFYKEDCWPLALRVCLAARQSVSVRTLRGWIAQTRVSHVTCG